VGFRLPGVPSGNAAPAPAWVPSAGRGREAAGCRKAVGGWQSRGLSGSPQTATVITSPSSHPRGAGGVSLGPAQRDEQLPVPGPCQTRGSPGTTRQWQAEPCRVGDVSPGQGLPIHQPQHVPGDVKLRPLLPLQPLLQDQPGKEQSSAPTLRGGRSAPRLPLGWQQSLGAPGQHRRAAESQGHAGDATLAGDASQGTLPPDQLPKECVQQGEHEVHHHEAIQVLPHTRLPALGRQAKVAPSGQQDPSSPTTFPWPSRCKELWDLLLPCTPFPSHPTFGVPSSGCCPPLPSKGVDGACGRPADPPLPGPHPCWCWDGSLGLAPCVLGKGRSRWHGMAWHGTAWHGMARHGPAGLLGRHVLLAPTRRARPRVALTSSAEQTTVRLSHW